MPITAVRTPDGRIIRVNHPDNATEAEIISYAQANAGAAPSDETTALATTLKAAADKIAPETPGAAGLREATTLPTDWSQNPPADPFAGQEVRPSAPPQTLGIIPSIQKTFATQPSVTERTLGNVEQAVGGLAQNPIEAAREAKLASLPPEVQAGQPGLMGEILGQALHIMRDVPYYMVGGLVGPEIVGSILEFQQGKKTGDEALRDIVHAGALQKLLMLGGMVGGKAGEAIAAKTPIPAGAAVAAGRIGGAATGATALDIAQQVKDGTLSPKMAAAAIAKNAALFAALEGPGIMKDALKNSIREKTRIAAEFENIRRDAVKQRGQEATALRTKPVAEPIAPVEAAKPPATEKRRPPSQISPPALAQVIINSDRENLRNTATDLAAEGYKPEAIPNSMKWKVATSLLRENDAETRKLIYEAAIKPVEALPVAPATYEGLQQGFGKVAAQDLYTLTEDIPNHPKGSTVTGGTLIDAGFSLPEKVAANEAAPLEPTTISAKKEVTANAKPNEANIGSEAVRAKAGTAVRPAEPVGAGTPGEQRPAALRSTTHSAVDKGVGRGDYSPESGQWIKDTVSKLLDKARTIIEDKLANGDLKITPYADKEHLPPYINNLLAKAGGRIRHFTLNTLNKSHVFFNITATGPDQLSDGVVRHELGHVMFEYTDYGFVRQATKEITDIGHRLISLAEDVIAGKAPSEVKSRLGYGEALQIASITEHMRTAQERGGNTAVNDLVTVALSRPTALNDVAQFVGEGHLKPGIDLSQYHMMAVLRAAAEKVGVILSGGYHDNEPLSYRAGADPAFFERYADAASSGKPKPPDITLSPKLGVIANDLVQTARGIRTGLNPTSASPEAAEVGRSLREKLGYRAREQAVAEKALDKARRFFDRAPEQDRLDFYDRMENGKTQPNADLNKIALVLRRALDKARSDVQNLGTGKLQFFIQNYMPHLWKDHVRASTFYERRPFQPSGFLKKRSIPTLQDGIANGLVPLTTNPVEAALMRISEMNRYVMAERALQEWQATGLAREVPSTGVPGGWSRINNRNLMMPEDAAKILNNYLSPGLRGKAWYRLAAGIGNTMNQAQLGLSAYHLMFTSIDATTSKTSLGVEQFFAGKPIKAASSVLQGLSTTAVFTNLIRGNKVLSEYFRPGTQGGDIPMIVDAMQSAGGRGQMDMIYRTESWRRYQTLVRGLFTPKGRTTGEYARTLRSVLNPLRAARAGLDLSAKPIMEYVVPRQKAGIFADLARFELERLGPDATFAERRAALQKVWDSVDNRMGQVVYDNYFWNRVSKDLAHIAVRSVGWNMGTITELGGAGVDLASLPARIARGEAARRAKGERIFTHKMAYAVALPTQVAFLGAVMHYLYNGKGPEKLEDYFHVPTGEIGKDGLPVKKELASYMRDVFAYGGTRFIGGTASGHPVQTIAHKANPMISALYDMLRNEDFYGTEIRHEGDPLLQQVKDLLQYTGKQFLPFSATNVMALTKQGETLPKALPAAIGITPVKKEFQRTRAETLMRDITYNRLPRAARTKEVAEKAQSEFAAIQGLRTGDEAPFASYIEQQNLSAHEIKALVKKASQDQFVAKFKALEIPDALRVWRVATPDERSKVSRPLISKMLRKLKDHPEIGRLYMNAADKMGIFDLMGASVPPPEPTPAEEANP